MSLAVRDLVSSARTTVARLQAIRRRAAELANGTSPEAAGANRALARLEALDAQLVTAPGRYQTARLPDQITFLFGVTLAADQQLGKDVYERYDELAGQLRQAVLTLDAIVAADLPSLRWLPHRADRSAGTLLLRGRLPGAPGLPRHGDRLVDPLPECLGLLQHVGGDLVVLHHLAPFAEWPERTHADGLEIGAVAVVHFEVHGVIRDQRKEEVTAVNADPAEHGAAADPGRDPAQLIDDEGAEGGETAIQEIIPPDASLPPQICMAQPCAPTGERHGI